MKHELKIEPEYFDNLISGRKKSVIRLNDRDYQVGDTIQFYNVLHAKIGSNSAVFVITHIHSGLGMADGYVCLSVEIPKTVCKDAE